jgi:hypothetical protein
MLDPDPDEFSAADRIRLRRLKQFMVDRGYVRNKYGFWVVPGLETESQADSSDDDEEIEE